MISFPANKIKHSKEIIEWCDRLNERVFLSSNGYLSQSLEMYQKNKKLMFLIYETRCLHLGTLQVGSLSAFHTIPNRYLFALWT